MTDEPVGYKQNPGGRIREWPVHLFSALLIVVMIAWATWGIFKWIWPTSPYSNIIRYGEWSVSDIEWGHNLTTSTCLDEQCVYLADAVIACYFVNGSDNKYSFFLLLPEKYSEWSDEAKPSTALVSLRTKATERQIGQISTTITSSGNRGHSTIVNISGVAAILKYATSSLHDENDFLLLDGGRPIRTSFPLLGFSDGLTELYSRCGAKWRVP